MNEERYSRNIEFFGAKGQEAISTSTIGVVGLGGLGSHVIQQLVYLGVRSFMLIDDDEVSASNLNRLVGATPHDVGSSKVAIGERMIRAVARDGHVQMVSERLSESTSLDLLAPCDVVFGCVDDDLARLVIAEHSFRTHTPFFDLATEIGQDSAGLWYGGRVLFSGLGERCPSCMDLLDQRAMARESMTSEQRDADARIYGVPVVELADTGPSVVSLNGIVASLAVMEWMLWKSEVRPAIPLLHYRGQGGVVTTSGDTPSPNCYYCSLWNSRTTSS